MRRIAALVLLSLAGCGVQAIPQAGNAVDAAWGEVQNQYQRRADLVPNLVATVKGYAQHEEQTFTQVAQARSAATSIHIDPSQLNQESMQKFEAAQSQLTGALSRLLVVAEKYPELKANENFRDLQVQLEGTENRISIARRRYIEEVQKYNDLLTVPPTSFTNSLLYHRQPKPQFQATTEGAETAPKVQFSILALVLSALAVPPLTGPVVDEAHVLSASDAARLDALARSSLQQGGPQLGFLTVPSLEGEDIADYSIRVAEAWKLGTAQKDNGLLFVVAVEDHRMRIEVGGGLEGEITDAQSGRIIRDTLTPSFRAGQYGEGLYIGARQALQMAGVNTPGGPVPAMRQPRRQVVPVAPLLLLGGFFLFIRLLGRRRRGIFWGGPWIGGGGFGGGGGGGGGSWGGGGGGFSGGGSSGSW